MSRVRRTSSRKPTRSKTGSPPVPQKVTKRRVEEMASQMSDDATQPISQSVYTELIRSRTREEVQEGDVPEADVEAVVHEDTHTGHTQFTCIEGDTGFLDLVSSLPTPRETSQHPILSDLSPTQSQLVLTQFPESQRFKTPATIGKKRDYNGNTIEKTILPVNPLKRNDSTEAVNLLGLSQAFAATQAASSPFVALPTSAFRSDRPSPQVGIIADPHNQHTSSPLRALPLMKRVGTEPAIQYISVNGSQYHDGGSEDNPKVSTKPDTVAGDDEDSDDEPRVVTRKRRERFRDIQAKQQIQRASSPISLDTTRLENDGNVRQTRSVSPLPITTRSESLPSSPPGFTTGEVVFNPVGTAEKSVRANLVPKTPANIDLSSLDSSLLARNNREETGMMLVPDTTRKVTRKALQSSPEIIASSWPKKSQERTRRQALRFSEQQQDGGNGLRYDNGAARNEPQATVPLLSQESIDRIPASPEPQIIHDRANVPCGIVGVSYAELDVLPDEPVAQHVQLGNRKMVSVVLETSSAHIDKSSKSIRDLQKGRQSNLPLTTPVNDMPQSSFLSTESDDVIPAHGTVHKRRRIMDVSQDTTQKPASQSSNFDAADALSLDANPEYAKVLSSVYDDLDSDPIVPSRRWKIVRNPDDPRGTAKPQYQIPSVSENVVSIDSMCGDIPKDRNAAQEAPPKVHSPLLQVQSAENNSNEASTEPPRSKNIISAVPSPAKTLGRTDTPLKSPSDSERRVQQRAPRNLAKSKKTSASVPAEVCLTPDLRSIKHNDKDHVATESDTLSTVSSTPAMHPELVKAPNMIFAYYMGKSRAYYPAISLGLSEDGQQYKIRWPGYEAENVAAHGICALDVRVGDEVKIDYKGFPKGTFLIQKLETTTTNADGDLTDIYGHNRVYVVLKQRKSLVGKLKVIEKSVPISSLYIDLAMWNRISKRPSHFREPAKTDETLLCTPAIRTSTPSTPSGRSRKSNKEATIQPTPATGVLKGMIFALTFESENTKEEMNKLIRSNGGTVLSESFADLINHKFNLKPEYNSAGFTALITDRHSRKGKYMQALALGLPCLNSRWIEASLEDSSYLQDWQDYLLPAGESAELGGAIRSRTLPPATITTVKLLNTFKSRRPFFNSAQIIFVMGKFKTEKRKEQRDLHLFFVQAMAPTGDVHVTADLDAAIEILQKLERDRKIWLIVADEHRRLAEIRVSEIQNTLLNDRLTANSGKRRDTSTNAVHSQRELDIVIADSEFVMQSLILGRLCRR